MHIYLMTGPQCVSEAQYATPFRERTQFVTCFENGTELPGELDIDLTRACSKDYATAEIHHRDPKDHPKGGILTSPRVISPSRKRHGPIQSTVFAIIVQ